MGEYPKYPSKYHWRKKFLIPQPYLYKMRTLEGLSVQEIADWHHKELGVKVSARLVAYYLTKFNIFKPKNFDKKSDYKRPPFTQSEAVRYLSKCLQLRRYPFRYLDKIKSTRRRKLVNGFFRASDKLDHVTKVQINILWSVFKKYEVRPGTADLFFPLRNVMIDWGKVDVLRADAGISISYFCERVEVDKRHYQRSVSRGFIRVKRKTALKVHRVLRCKQSKFSKEIKHDR